MFRFIYFLLVFSEVSQVCGQPTASKSFLISEREKAMASGISTNADRNDLDVKYYRCEWEVDPSIRNIVGKVTAQFRMVTASNQLGFDLDQALRVDSVIFHQGKPAFSQTSSNTVLINLANPIAAGQLDSVTIYYQGVPASNGSNSFVSRVVNGVPVLWTLSEPYGSKDWWPCKNNQSDKADSIDIYLTFPSHYKSSSNGLLVSELTQAGKTTAHWKHRYPIASYLVAIAVADYAVSVDSARIGTRSMPVKSYTYASNPNFFVEPASWAKRYLEKFSALFGPYPFADESYSQTQFAAGGGMEHQTNSFLTSNDIQLAIHELGHQWFGDKVTCASWQDIWLNEGFASYLQYLLFEYDYTDYRPTYLENTRQIITAQPDGSLRVNDTTNFNRIFNFRLSYAKGMSVIHMIRWKLGDSVFYAALRKYLNDPRLAYGVATTADLQRNLEEASGKNFSEFFRDWYVGEGYPSYQVAWSANANNWLNIKLGQTSSHSSVSFFEMPVPLLLRGSGRDSVIILNHKKSGEEFFINLGFVVDTVIFDPDLWLLSARNTVRHQAVSKKKNELRIFPNPAPGAVTVSLRNPVGKHLSITLINAAGQKLYSTRADLNGSDELYRIDMQRFSRGSYWIKVDGDDFATVKKLVK